MPQLNAFIARSFDPQDEERIRPVLEFLGTFRDAGFFCESADRAEVESVSKKVQGMIDERQVFIGFFTKRYPVYRFASGIRGILQILLPGAKPQIWSAPAWVLQESGYALRGGKDLILLKEPGVEVFGLQGDLEYVTFDAAKPAALYPRLNQMIHGLLAKAAGTEVLTVVSQRHEELQVAEEPTPVESNAHVSDNESREPTDVERLLEMQDAAARRDFGALCEAWEAGTALITQGKTKRIDQLAWNCLYHEARFDAGAPDGLETLRRLRRESPERVEPPLAIARCLMDSAEFADSAKLFLEASSLQEGRNKAHSLVSAAKAFREAKNYTEASKSVELAMPIAVGELREEAIRLRFQLLKDSGSDYLGFATAESALHENPQLSLRFSLGLDYRLKDLTELALFHFKFLHDHNKEDSSSLHNLALMYSDCKLPITSVKHYKGAISMGETLSAANLGFMYLDCGMADEAKQILELARRVEDHDGRVEKCLAEIVRRVEQEEEKQRTLLNTADANRGVLVKMGQALSRPLPNVDGRWKFPFGEVALAVASDRVSGTAEVKSEASMLIASVLGQSPSGLSRTERYTLDGALSGCVCQFDLTVKDVSGSLSITGFSSLLPASGNKSGFIVFESDGKSATYIELTSGKLGNPEPLTRIDQST